MVNHGPVTNTRAHMQRALEMAQQCPPGGPRVGAVIARGDEVLSAAHRGESDGKHAEQLALERAAADGKIVKGASMYTTLEPCANSVGKRVPCAHLISEAKVISVFIGAYDTNPQVYRLGWKHLRDAGIVVRDFDRDLREAAQSLNSDFSGYFTQGIGITGKAKFDFTQRGGQFDIRASEDADAAIWTTRWTNRGANSIYAYGGTPGAVCLARFATAFDEIDDPDALDWGSHSVPVAIGEIAIFRNGHGHLLCRVEAIEPTADHGGGPQVSVTICWEARPLT